jgi:hypothetical protein
MAKNEDHEDRSTGLQSVALSMLLGIAAFFGFSWTLGVALGVLARGTLFGPWAWQALCIFAASLLISASAIWGLQRLNPSRLKFAALSVLLGIAAVFGFSGTAGVVKGLVATQTLWGPWGWQTLCILAVNVLMGVGAIWSLLRLTPWKGWKGSREPVSPATRRTNKLFGLSGLVGALGFFALFYGINGKDDPSRMFSNSPVSLGVASVAISFWLLSNAIGWWWYFSADEHERRANDFGFLAAGGLFLAVTPAWWVGARAGLLPQPDAMVLWLGTVAVTGIGWFWRRS